MNNRNPIFIDLLDDDARALLTGIVEKQKRKREKRRAKRQRARARKQAAAGGE